MQIKHFVLVWFLFEMMRIVFFTLFDLWHKLNTTVRVTGAMIIGWYRGTLAGSTFQCAVGFHQNLNTM